MTDSIKKPTIDMTSEEATTDATSAEATTEETSTKAASDPQEFVKQHTEQLDEDEAEFQKLRRDIPGVKGASAAGIQSIAVDKLPAKKNAFFRTHPKYCPVIQIVMDDVGMEKHFYAVSDDMAKEFARIGIATAEYTLYFTLSLAGSRRVVPVRCADEEGERHASVDTKERGLLRGVKEWVRIFWDGANGTYECFEAPAGKYGEPQFPELTPGKIFRCAFVDRGRYVNSTDHMLYRKFAEGERSL